MCYMVSYSVGGLSANQTFDRSEDALAFVRLNSCDWGGYSVWEYIPDPSGISDLRPYSQN